MLPEPQQRWACNTVSSRSLVLRRQLKGFWKAWYTAPALCPRPLARAVGACRKGHGAWLPPAEGLGAPRMLTSGLTSRDPAAQSPKCRQGPCTETLHTEVFWVASSKPPLCSLRQAVTRPHQEVRYSRSKWDFQRISDDVGKGS